MEITLSLHISRRSMLLVGTSTIQQINKLHKNQNINESKANGSHFATPNGNIHNGIQYIMSSKP